MRSNRVYSREEASELERAVVALALKEFKARFGRPWSRKDSAQFGLVNLSARDIGFWREVNVGLQNLNDVVGRLERDSPDVFSALKRESHADRSQTHHQAGDLLSPIMLWVHHHREALLNAEADLAGTLKSFDLKLTTAAVVRNVLRAGELEDGRVRVIRPYSRDTRLYGTGHYAFSARDLAFIALLTGVALEPDFERGAATTTESALKKHIVSVRTSALRELKSMHNTRIRLLEFHERLARSRTSTLMRRLKQHAAEASKIKKELDEARKDVTRTRRRLRAEKS